MASVSYNYYVGNGVKKDYEFTQELNTKATVYGLVNQIETAGTWDSGTGFFTFTVAPASGAQIWIARRTSNDTAVATYPNKSYINSENLDADFRQSLMQVQEAQFDNDQAVLLNAGAPGYAAAAAASAAAALVSENAAAADLVLTNADVVLTNADVVTTGLNVTYAEEWATKPEDSLISVAAGGDGVSDYSALHWAAKAAGIATNYVLKAGDTMTGSLTLTNGSSVYCQASGSPQYPIIGMKDSFGVDRFRMQYNHDGSNAAVIYRLDNVAAVEAQIAFNSDGTLTGSTGMVPTAGDHIVNKTYSDTKLALSGGTVTGQIKGITPVADEDLGRKDYIDEVRTRPNTLINAMFDNWQRGTAVALATGIEQYLADRWFGAFSGAGGVTLVRTTDVPTVAQSGNKSNYAMVYSITTADTSIGATDLYGFGYRMEGFDYAKIAGGDAIFSFWMKSNAAGIHCVSIRNSGSNRSYIREFTVATANVWEKHEVTFPLTETGGTWNYLTGMGLEIFVCAAAGSNYHGTKDTWLSTNDYASTSQVNGVATTGNTMIAQAKFEEGDFSTALEPVNTADDLARCERYYQILNNVFFSGDVSSGQTYYTSMNLRVQMRATPAATLINGGNAQFGSTPSTWAVDDKVYGAQRTATGTGTGLYHQYAKLDAEL